MIIEVRYPDGRRDWLTVDEYVALSPTALAGTRVRMLHARSKA